MRIFHPPLKDSTGRLCCKKKKKVIAFPGLHKLNLKFERAFKK